VRLRACALVVGLSGLIMLRPVHAAEMPVDDGLLEFLGSVDSDDQNWRDYLAASATDPAARRVGTSPANPGAPGPPASAPPSAAPPPGGSPRPGAPAGPAP
jgi:hypothetical protein